VLRPENDKADALAKLAASLTLPDEREIQITIGEHQLLPSALDRFDETEEINVVSIFKVEEKADLNNLSLSISSMTSYPLIQRGE